MSKSYKIHDNWARTFEVMMTPNQKIHLLLPTNKAMSSYSVHVYRLSDDDNHNRVKTVLTIEDAIVFVGSSPKMPMTEFSGGWGDRFEGNTALIRDMAQNVYYMVWAGIDKFTLPDDTFIVDYVSPVGNNDVPYPYAIDNKHNVYLAHGHTILLNGEQRLIGNTQSGVPYYTTLWDMAKHPFSQYFTLYDPHDNEHMIDTWSSNPACQYDRFVKNGWQLRTTEKYDATGTIRVPSRDEYITFSNAYAQQHGLKPLVYEQVEPRFIKQ